MVCDRLVMAIDGREQAPVGLVMPDQTYADQDDADQAARMVADDGSGDILAALKATPPSQPTAIDGRLFVAFCQGQEEAETE